MNTSTHITLALQSLNHAAQSAKKSASTLEALQTLLAAANGDNPNLDVETLAKVLLNLDLCIVHRHIVGQALEVVKQAEDVDGLSYEQLGKLQERLQLAHEGIAQRGEA